jgi:AraC-like DNA-binding protein
MSGGPPIALRRHDGPEHRFEIATRAPAAPLAGLVRAYVGYTEHAAHAVRRLQVPFAGLPLIISFGPAIDVAPTGAPERRRRVTSFLAGLHDHAVVTAYEGPQAGLQADLTPLGAAVLFSGLAAEAANRVVDLADLLGAGAGRLEERLALSPDWAARFDILDAVLTARLACARRPAPEVRHAVGRILSSRGGVPIARLAAEAGWSRKHLAARMRAEVGLSPKTLARIARFEHAVTRIGEATSLADLAAACGYADQAHLGHEFRALAGTTPGAYAAALGTGGLGVAA